jgi:hypothetical protein
MMPRCHPKFYSFGHRIYTKPTIVDGVKTFDKWRFLDNDKSIEEDKHNRLCPKCKLPPTPEGHDPCIANLPGVDYACCGHGVELGYVMFSNGQVIRGRFDKRFPRNDIEEEQNVVKTKPNLHATNGRGTP